MVTDAVHASPDMPPSKRPTPPQTVVHAGASVSGRTAARPPSSKTPARVATGPSLASKALTELLGTGLLTFTIAVAAGQGAYMAPVAIGSTLMCAVYAGGHVSGAHYNPAVTLALLVRGWTGLLDSIVYVTAQLLGGLGGGALAMVLEPGWTPAASGSSWPATPDQVGIGFA